MGMACIGVKLGKDFLALSPFSLSEVGVLEQNIECDCCCTAFTQVFDDFGVDGSIPVVVVP